MASDQKGPAERRMDRAIEEADQAFWAAIAAAYPEAESGDLSPGAAIQLGIAMRAAVAEWVCNNA